ncbi:MAG: hypothetical protein A3J10_02090 [Candidatus Sungbacteria bacterium RIFCSPLOWO2_02_FULL_54_10]|nr:MAG: hypothetical protein A3J10_02090 [Candidatus Sungbacteria bacterium RIFCSPLOWO2_02_FULL_54_10]
MEIKTSKVIFFDIYQTLIDIDIDEAHKKANEAKGWEVFVKSLEQYDLAVASYTQGCYTQTELKELGIEKFFTHFIYTSDIGFHKASPEFYKQCLATVGKGAGDCVMIGDNYNVDVLVPQKLGMKTIWVKNPATAAQYAPSLPQGGERIIDLEKFVHLPEVIDDIFN